MDYLDRTAYEPGEFVQTQHMLDGLLLRLQQELRPTIERGLVTQLSSATADTWTALTHAALSQLLGRAASDVTPGQEAVLEEFAAQLQRKRSIDRALASSDVC